jgi:predicted ATP-dependent protease
MAKAPKKARKQRSKKSIGTESPVSSLLTSSCGSRRLFSGELCWVSPDLKGVVAKHDRELKKRDSLDCKEQRRRRRAYRCSRRPEEFIGQGRAVRGLQLGLSLDAPGYHIFVMGPEGSGRRSLIEAALEAWASPFPKPRDRLLVHNFKADRPLMLTFPGGKGARFKRDMEDLFDVMIRRIRHFHESDEWVRRRENLVKLQDRKEKDAFFKVREKAEAAGFVIPNLIDGELFFSLDRHRYSKDGLLAALDRGTVKLPYRRKRFREYEELSAELLEAQSLARGVLRSTPRKLRQLERLLIERCILGYLEDLRIEYPTQAVATYLDSYSVGLLEHFDELIEEDDDDGETALPYQFRINYLVDARELGDARYLCDNDASLKSLLGGLDSDRVSSEAPEFLKVRAGSLLRCDGRALIVDARELNNDSSGWKALKKCLLEGRIPLPVNLGAIDCPLTLKIVFVGSEDNYHDLIDCDELHEMVKIRVEMETSIVASQSSVHALGTTYRDLAWQAGLSLPDAGALGRLLEHAARNAQRQGHLCLLMGPQLDLIREAECFSKRRVSVGPDNQSISLEDVSQALAARKDRQSLQERQTQALISNGIVLIDAMGHRIGQVNALVVYENGDQSFARPCRITATVAVGWKGIIDIEREAALSGETHHKGVQIISGLLRNRYGDDKPLVLTAGLCFEQSYSPIDGDSASTAEVIAVLSSLARVPINQALAVSGSVNQLGDLQAVGGVNEKIEGFYDACMKAGMTGDQGVLIPEANVLDLNLREDVISAIEAGHFHVYSAATLDGALERLTSPVDPSTDCGTGKIELFHRGVNARLKRFADAWKTFKKS